MKSSLLALLGIVVVGGGIYVATQSGTGVIPEGATLIDAMYAEAEEVNSVSYKGTLDASGTDADNVAATFHVDFNGASVSSDDVSSGTAKLSVTAVGEVGEGEEKMNFSGGLEVLGLDKEAYIKISLGEETLAQVPFGALVNDRWIRINLEELASTGLIPPETLTEINSSTNLEDIEKIREIMVSHEVLIATSVEKGEKINGEDTFHFILNINEDEMVAAINELAVYFSEPAITAADEAEMKAAIVKFEQAATMEMWVGEDTKLPRRYKLVANVPTEEGSTDVIKIELVVDFDNFNEKVEVEAPEGSVSITDILAPFLGGMMAPQ